MSSKGEYGEPVYDASLQSLIRRDPCFLLSPSRESSNSRHGSPSRRRAATLSQPVPSLDTLTPTLVSPRFTLLNGSSRFALLTRGDPRTPSEIVQTFDRTVSPFSPVPLPPRRIFPSP